MSCAAGDVASFTARLLTGVTPRWVGCEPEHGPRIYYANHSSHLDPLMIWACLPRDLRNRVHPVAARDYWRTGRLRRYLARDIFKAILIDRRSMERQAIDRESLKRLRKQLDVMSRVLEADRSLILFPEGTRRIEEGLGDFLPGIYHLARRCKGVVCVPVFLNNMNRILPKGEFLPVPIMGSVFFGAPIAYNSGESKEAFLAKAHTSLLELMDGALGKETSRVG
ncbi:1-acyl-sn-glycerol-3-phosphate acyltransferase [bacterium]|nr:1-acyl-sn-glycerol-3-phosphate acyltransferase [bacterium]